MEISATRWAAAAIVLSAFCSTSAAAECITAKLAFTGELAAEEPFRTVLSYPQTADNPLSHAVEVQLALETPDVIALSIRQCAGAADDDRCDDWKLLGKVFAPKQNQRADHYGNEKLQWHVAVGDAGTREVEVRLQTGDVVLGESTRVDVVRDNARGECLLGTRIVSVKTVADSVRDELNPYVGDIPEATTPTDAVRE